MFNFQSLFHKQQDQRLKDQIADLLKTSPEKLAQFEEAYRKAALCDDTISDNFFDINSRQASAQVRTNAAIPETFDQALLEKTIRRAVDELTAETPILAISDGQTRNVQLPALPVGNSMLTNQDLNQIPKEIRPQATGSLMKVDIDAMASKEILPMYVRAMRESNPQKAKMFYQHFRQGMDILDLDPILYEMLGCNQNSMSHWLPAITAAANKHGFFRIPETRIAKVPMPILQLSRLDYASLTPSTLKIVDDWAIKAFDLDVTKTYFIKTGTFSSKFDFRNAKVTGEKEVRELGEYLLFIQHQASCMAHPTAQPCIYGVSTTNEWVVREFIEDTEQNPCIYKGMPLHTEYRVFVDFDTNEILGINPYWDPEVMKHRFSQEDDAASPHQRHDYIIYKMHEETLMGRYNTNKGTVLAHIQELLPDVTLKGQWSIDIMQNGDDFWLIDMATADTSALNQCIPAGKLKKAAENWLPEHID